MMRLTFFATRNDDGLRHREIGLAGAGRADAEDDVVGFDRVEVFPLVDGLGRHAALAGGRDTPFQEVLAQIDRPIPGDEVGCRLDVGVRELAALAQQ